MLKGLGRHELRGQSFAVRPNMGPGSARPARVTGMTAPRAETADYAPGTGVGAPVVTSFSKPTGLGLNAGLVSDGTQAQIVLAREMVDNDSVCSAVAQMLGGIPFGRFSLSGMPDVEHQTPYLRSLDHMRTQNLMPLLTTTFLTDGAFLGSGMFDNDKRHWTAIILQDLLHATITPSPFFGTTPVIDVNVNPDLLRGLVQGDPRLARYSRFATRDLRDGVMRLQPENTFYIPRLVQAHNVYGQSLFKPVMILYLLEKALARGTIEMAYRRQKPIIHIQVGDETWDASLEEMQATVGLFQNADADPVSAFVVTRPGVNVNEVGGISDMFKWTDVLDNLTSAKLKGLGLPDGLLGGDVALDSVSATLTVFINMVRNLRDYITRAFMYEKVFPYVSIMNDHKKDKLGVFEEHGRVAQWMSEELQTGSNYRSVASDTEIDMSEYLMPTITYHNSMRPEGDREYLSMLTELSQAGVPIGLRQLAAAGGQDMHDLLNGARDELELQGQAAKLRAAINKINEAAGPQDDGQGGGMQGDGSNYDGGGQAGYASASTRQRRRIVDHAWSDRDLPRTRINGHSYVTTARERRRRMEQQDRVTARAMAEIARRENGLHSSQVVRHGPRGSLPL